MRLLRSRAFYVCLALVASIILMLANIHLVMVAGSSQPACVEHARPGEPATVATGFSAAQSSC